MAATVFAALALPVSAQAAQFFVSPSGSGTACTAAQPCTLQHGIATATSSSDEVIVGPGTYSPNINMTVNNATVHGVAGQRRPVIAFGDTHTLAVVGSTAVVRYLDIETTNAMALEIEGGLAEQVVTHSVGGSSFGCADLGGVATIRDSVCEGEGGGSAGARVGNNTTGGASLTLRNVTAYSSDASGLFVVGSGGGSTADAFNTIARGGAEDVQVTDFASAQTGTADLQYSNYSPTHVSTSGSGANINDFGHNQSAAPSFVNAAGHDFHETSASAGTLNVGITNALNGPLDFEGDQRSPFGTTDIGADEFVGAPAALTGGASGVTTTAATIGGTVNPDGGLTTARLEYGLTTAYGTSVAVQSIGNGTSPVALSATLNALAPGTTYHYRVVGSSSGGTGNGSDMTFTTAGPAPPSDGPLNLSANMFAARRSGPSIVTARHRRRPVGTVISYADSQAAATTFTVERPAAGIRRGGRCVARPRHSRSRHPRRCVRYVRVGSFTHLDVAGLNRFRFTGRVNGRALRPGRYRITAVPVNLLGLRGAPSRHRFRIVR